MVVFSLVLLSCSGTGGGIYAKLANGMARHNRARHAMPIMSQVSVLEADANLALDIVSLGVRADRRLNAARLGVDPSSDKLGSVGWLDSFGWIECEVDKQKDPSGCGRGLSEARSLP